VAALLAVDTCVLSGETPLESKKGGHSRAGVAFTSAGAPWPLLWLPHGARFHLRV
jgi:hypothetical protein